MSAALKIVEESMSQHAEHQLIPSWFEVNSVYEVLGDEPTTVVLREVPVHPPWIKSYQLGDEWVQKRLLEWDVSNWGLLGAYLNGERIGGCVLKYKTVGKNPLQEEAEVAELSDIRLRSDAQGQGIGRRLFQAAVQWAHQRDCRALKIYTQNINVRACRLYRGQGCELVAIHRGIFAEFPDEIELVWRLAL